MTTSVWVARMLLLTVVVGAGSAAFGAAELLVVGPIRDLRAREMQLRSDHDVMRRRRVEAEAEARMLENRRTAGGATQVWNASSGEALATDLQGIVRDILARAGAMSVATQASKEVVGSAGTVTILVRARVAEGGMSAFLGTIERHSPLLLVKSFDVTVLPGQTDTPLEFTAVISAFYADAI